MNGWFEVYNILFAVFLSTTPQGQAIRSDNSGYVQQYNYVCYSNGVLDPTGGSCGIRPRELGHRR